MRSCLYVGRISHRRHEPVEHEFEYPLWMAWLDLDELDDVFRGRWLWSAHRPALIRFRREDHLGDSTAPLDESVRELIHSKTAARPTGPIRMLTPLRYAGFWINPVCFYYCYDAPGKQLEWIVAEVNNTPWNERHCYVLDASEQSVSCVQQRHSKEFHVSPFMALDQEYRWRIGTPGESLNIGISNYERGHSVFEAHLRLQQRPLTALPMAGVVWKFPFQTWRVCAAIYWQALKLWWKKCPYYPHPGKTTPADVRHQRNP